MDLFLAHISSHDVPGGLWTLYTTFLVALAAYLLSIANNHTAPDAKIPLRVGDLWVRRRGRG